MTTLEFATTAYVQDIDLGDGVTFRVVNGRPLPLDLHGQEWRETKRAAQEWTRKTLKADGRRSDIRAHDFKARWSDLILAARGVTTHPPSQESAVAALREAIARDRAFVAEMQRRRSEWIESHAALAAD